MNINDLEFTNDELNKIKKYYIKKSEKIKKLNINVMNKINNNDDLTKFIYKNCFSKIKMINSTFELIESQLKEIKSISNKYLKLKKNNHTINVNELLNQTTQNKDLEIIMLYISFYLINNNSLNNNLSNNNLSNNYLSNNQFRNNNTDNIYSIFDRNNEYSFVNMLD